MHSEVQVGNEVVVSINQQASLLKTATPPPCCFLGVGHLPIPDSPIRDTRRVLSAKASDISGALNEAEQLG